ncbi:putative pentatricopeptide repeat-containing protein At3g01580 isoform X1 [Cucurbita moschata]|uniref:Pentatricopeptide repeat-containing protein At3g01580 isoform X1 n=2 Tax=Cucurbita moschata TaxID=3662 RepID=A0A6J1F3K2_CUCMO|nr:putative pentatricopeptide repeat-containing protein At3g01580 isoform X1 [Cucurbita moschata]
MKSRDQLVKLFEKCKCSKNLAELQCYTLKIGLAHDTFFATKLSALHGKYTSLVQAHKVFEETPSKTVHLWNAILRSYCKEKQWGQTLYLFNDMVSHGISNGKPDNFTIPIVLKACAGLQALKFGKTVHGFIKKNEKTDLDMFVGAALIELYSKCGKMHEALQVFLEFPQPDVVLWTSMITGYEQNGNPKKSVDFFSQMVMIEHVNPDPVTLVSLASACTQLSNSKLGSSIHGFITRRNLDYGLSLANSLLNLYVKTGSVKAAANLFEKMPIKDVISWSSLIACYAHNGAAAEALNLFNKMIDQKIKFNSVTVIGALQACAVECNLEEGKKIHELVIRKGLELDISVSTALIDMYMKCFSPEEALVVFEKMPKKDVVSWATLLSGYSVNGMSSKSMGTFNTMLLNNIKPDAVAIVKILASCSDLGILQQALCLHDYVVKSGFTDNVFVGASLIELYSKCGSTVNAMKVFEEMKVKDIVTWSAIIAGYGIQGQGREALKLFDKMRETSEVMANEVTFLSLLSACSHAGLIEEGIKIFNMMLNEYRIEPNMEHYGIIVDLLGRTGELNRALNFVQKMPIPAGPHVWGALLGAACIHHKSDLGEIAANNLFKLDPNHAGYYILLSNIYAVENNWENVGKLRNMIKEKGLKKILGQSVIEAGSEVHSFVADDRLHPKSDQIYRLLRNLNVNMRDEGYSSNSKTYLQGIEEIV